MKKLINILLVLFLTFIPYYSNVRAENNFNYETSYMLVIDASGSMASNTRIERAKSAAQSFINSVKGKNVEVGLIAFYNCGDVRVIHELTSDVEKLIDPLNSIQPSGTTPLVGAISFSADYLKQHGTGQKGKLIVYTDGADTCGGNYQDARNALEGLEIDIWGIDLPEYVEKELEENLNVPVQDLPEDEPGELVRIFVEPYPSDFSVGQTIQTVVKAEWSNGKITTLNPLEVSYKSSREDRVIVSTDGKLTALNRGTSFIDYEYQGKTFRNIVNVNPAPVLEDFYLETALPSTMEIGDKYTVTGLKAKWSNGTVTDVSINDVLITSSREDRIKVKNGELEALDSGTSYIDFTFNGKKIRNLISVVPGPKVVDFYLDTALPSTMKIGDKYTISGLKAKMSDGTIKDLSVSDVTVTSSRTDRVNVTGGELEALASGTSYIDISYNGKTIRKLVTVESTATIGDFYLDTALPSTMKIGDKYTISGLKAKMSDGTIKDLSVSDVTVTSSRTDRVNVTGGELEALASGTSYIDISYNGKTIRKLVTVESTATIGDFYLDTAFPSTMKIGDKYTISGLKAKMSDGTIKDLSVSDVTVTSSRTDRVNVTGGELEALASGTSYIDISYNGKIIRKLVTVESTATIVDFYLDTALPSTMKIGDKYTISGLKAKMSDGTIKDLSVSDVTVTSSRTDRVNVTGGELEALASGTSYIDISYNGKTIRKLVTVESTATIGDFYLDTALPSTMKIGDKYTISGLKAKMSDGTIKDLSVSDVTVTSSRTDRVNVTGGELEALASGTSYIDISYNGKIIRKLVTVESTATIVDFYLDTAFPSTMKIGDKYTISGLKAKMSDGTIKDLSVSDVTVTSSRTDRVNVNGGDLEAISKGTSYIDIIYNNKRIRSLITVSQ